MAIPLSELNQLTGSFNPEECSRNLRKILQDPFPDVDRVSVILDELFDPRTSPDWPVSGFSHQGGSSECASSTGVFESRAESNDPACFETLAGLAREMDSTLRVYDLQVLFPCFVHRQCIGWLLLWRNVGAPSMSKRTRKVLHARMPFATFLMMDLMKTARPRLTALQFLDAAMSQMVEEGHLGKQEAAVAICLIRGWRYGAIGELMNISISAVQKHVRRIYGKLGVHTARELINAYLLEPILKPAEGGKGLGRYTVMNL